MIELLQIVWDLVLGLLAVCQDLALLLWDVTVRLHTDVPLLVVLLLGVGLTWVLLRRDKHPLLRVLSAPLKLIVDILDLAWDQVVEVLGDLVGTVRGWISKSLGWCWGRVKSAWSWGVGLLVSVRDRLLRPKDSA